MFSISPASILPSFESSGFNNALSQVVWISEASLDEDDGGLFFSSLTELNSLVFDA